MRSPNSPKEDFQFAVPDSVIRNPFNARNENRENAIVEATPTKPRGRSLGSFAPPSLPSFSQRRDSSVSASVANATKSGDFADVKEKENLAPPIVEAEADEEVDIIKAFGWDDADDLIPT